MSDNRENNVSFLFGALVGSLVGAAVAILLAPDSGANTRTALKSHAYECKDKLSVLAGEYKERFASITEEYREKLKELSAEMRERRQRAVAGESEEALDNDADEDTIEDTSDGEEA